VPGYQRQVFVDVVVVFLTSNAPPAAQTGRELHIDRGEPLHLTTHKIVAIKTAILAHFSPGLPAAPHANGGYFQR
jgi:hypothetical protein